MISKKKKKKGLGSVRVRRGGTRILVRMGRMDSVYCRGR